MGQTSLQLSKQYTSFSGADIRIVISGETVGTAQALSYAIQREKAPNYVLGRVDPLAFSRGKRGIAGTVVALMFDQHILLKPPFSLLKFVADNDEIYPSVTNLNNATEGDLATIGGQDPGDTTFSSSDISSNFTVTSPWYIDQIPPVDTVVIGVNEYGNAATMRIYGMEFLNEGSGFSVDDMNIETQTTYVARSILPWQPLGQWDETWTWQGATP
jgi:hypothetical protein